MKIRHISCDFDFTSFRDPEWQKAADTDIRTYWSGEKVPVSRQFKVRLLWSDDSLFVKFDAQQRELLVVGDVVDFSQKTIGLWERDVCEIFIAPHRNEPRKYFEFEVAPTGEWLDLAIDSTSGERVTDWDYRSGMEVAAKIEDERVIIAMKIPWDAFGKKPKAGDVWLGNIFRCVGKEPHRGYLAWQPTFTEKPSFHVPESFGQFVFVGQ